MQTCHTFLARSLALALTTGLILGASSEAFEAVNDNVSLVQAILKTIHGGALKHDAGPDDMNMMQKSVDISLDSLNSRASIRAWLPRVASGVPSEVVWLSAGALIALALKGKIYDWREDDPSSLKSRRVDSQDLVTQSDSNDSLQETELSDTRSLRKVQASSLVEVPLPTRRLRQIGASYVIPYRTIKRHSSDTLSFDIPMLPCVWPLHAVLSRTSEKEQGQKSPWDKIELTVDIIKASGLPPLLSCTPATAVPGIGGCAGTGGTVSEGSPAGSCASTGEGAGTGSAGQIPWLHVFSSNGTPVASIMPVVDGSCAVLRQDNSCWDVEVRFDRSKPWMTVLKSGQEISQASVLGATSEAHLQVDTQPDTQSPESVLLLMIQLAILAFGDK